MRAATVTAFATALAAYQAGNVHEALAHWDAVAAVAPDDAPTRFYRTRTTAQLQALPPTAAGRLPAAAAAVATTVYMTDK